MIKILHTGDIHLDSPFSLCDVRKAQIRKNELRGTFTSLMMYAKMENFDIVLMSGDIFDTGFATKETMELMKDQFAQNPNCRFIISPGNHDPLNKKSPYRKVDFPENVYIFSDDDITKFSFNDIGVDVYGWAFTDNVKEQNPLRLGKIQLNSERVNILCAHADMMSANSKNCPINENDIASSGFDYVALGHIHAGGEVKKAGRTYYAYCGCLEGRSFDECGPKGAIVCKIETSGGRTDMIFGQKRFSRRRYEKMDVDVSNAIGTPDILNIIRAKITENGLGDDTLLRLRLCGVVSPDLKIDEKQITAEALGLFYVETINDTLPLLNYKELMNDISIKGAFFRELLPKLKSEDDEERRIASAALRYGLAALSGDDIIDF